MSHRPSSAPGRSAGVAVLVLAFSGCEGTDPAAPPGPLGVTPDSAEVVVGDTVRFAASGGSGAVTWTVTDPSVATVDPTSGVARGVAPGVITVRASAGGETADATLRVVPPPALVIALDTLSAVVAVEDRAVRLTLPPVRLENGGGGVLGGLTVESVQYDPEAHSGWLSASLSSSTAPALLSLVADASGLDAGRYRATLMVGSTQTPVESRPVRVALAVLGPPVLGVAVDSLSRTLVPGAAATDTFTVSDAGDRPLAGLAVSVAMDGEPPASWLSASIDGETAPATVTVSYSAAGVPKGSYRGEVTVSADHESAQPVVVPVRLDVVDPPVIGVERDRLAFQAVQGQPIDESVVLAVRNDGGGDLTGLTVESVTYWPGDPGGWLSVDLESPVAPTRATVRVRTEGLGPGQRQAVVRLAAPGAAVSPTVTVELTVSPAPHIFMPRLTGTVSFCSGCAEDVFDTLREVFNVGGGTLSGLEATITFTAYQPAGWAQAFWSEDVTTAPATLVVRVSRAGLPPGTYTATVTVSSTLPLTNTVVFQQHIIVAP